MLCDHTLQGHLGTLCMPGALATSLLCLRGCMRPSVCLAIAWWAGGIHGAGKQGEWSRMEEERMEGGWRGGWCVSPCPPAGAAAPRGPGWTCAGGGSGGLGHGVASKKKSLCLSTSLLGNYEEVRAEA